MAPCCRGGRAEGTPAPCNSDHIMPTCTDTSAIDYLLMAIQLVVFLILVFAGLRGIQKIITGSIYYVLDRFYGLARRGLRMGGDKRL